MSTEKKSFIQLLAAAFGFTAATEAVEGEEQRLSAENIQAMISAHDSAKTKITELDGTIAGLNTKVTGLESQVSEKETKIQELTQQLASVRGALPGVAITGSADPEAGKKSDETKFFLNDSPNAKRAAAAGEKAIALINKFYN
jgi:chromosome segregation ATPase